MVLHTELANTLQLIKSTEVPKKRQEVLQPLIDYIQSKASTNIEALLNFICTHNSRRSQLAQIWAQTAAYYYKVNAVCYSGGVEVTAFNARAVSSIKRAGFKISSQGKSNPTYAVSFSDEAEPIKMFSKLYNDGTSPSKYFAAVMTCSDADKNCPLIPGTEARIPVRYEDPKAFDGTSEESAKYDERSMQIASEMFYVFSKIR